MKGTTHLILRGLSILTILFLLSTAVLIAQVKIKEKVKINPKINHTMKTNESSSNLPCFAGQVDTISDRQYIIVLRPYIITAMGTLTYEVRLIFILPSRVWAMKYGHGILGLSLWQKR